MAFLREAAPAGDQIQRAGRLRPVRVGIDLPGGLQVIQLLESREGAELVDVVRHLDALEDLAQLARAVAGREAALETRQFV